MKLLDLTLPTPTQNLACDEALLEWRERKGGEEILRFWESPDYFVVVGYANKMETEVNLAACRAQEIPVLRRCSGGGTVVQGRGCLNYALLLDISRRKELETLGSTNRFVMERNRDAVQKVIAEKAKDDGTGVPPAHSSLIRTGGTPIPPVDFRNVVEIHGVTDLAISKIKFSGNAQRRGKRFVLFHGSFLLDFDLAMIGKLLPMPTKQPQYRENRSHEDFLMNLGVPAAKIKKGMRAVWGADKQLKHFPSMSP